MQLLDLIHRPLDFTEEKCRNLQEAIENLRQTLIAAGFNCYAEQLLKVRQAATDCNSSKLREHLNSRVLFGGFGAMWEIWISDKSMMRTFEAQFRIFLNSLEDIGVRNNKIEQIKRVFL